MLTRIIFVSILLLGSLGSASAISYLPLAEGTISQLTGEANPANTLTVSVLENLGPYAILYLDENGGNDWDTWLRMSQDPDGTTYLLAQSFDGGASWNETTDPILWIETPLAVGNSWSQSTMLGSATFEITSEVVSHDLVTVPAGQFMAFCIQHVGVVGGAITNTYIEWYAENIGIVKIDWTGFAQGDIYALTGAHIVATEPCTWGQVKALFR